MRKMLFWFAMLLQYAVPVFAGGLDGPLVYRGFTADISAIGNFPRRAEIEKSLIHQLDIVADCGARHDVLAFFRAQQIVLKSGMGDVGAEFAPDSRVIIDAVPEPPEQPIVLHELLHAYHARVLPDGIRNADVLTYYHHAKEAALYPLDAYLLKNQSEFFAVTASLYLWGHVDREPFTRENLRAKQPYYYAWLGNLFGVRK
jgi:hypothetical protein